MQKLLFLIFIFSCIQDIAGMEQSGVKTVHFAQFNPRNTRRFLSSTQRQLLHNERSILCKERMEREKTNRQARIQDIADEQDITYAQAHEQEIQRKNKQKRINAATIGAQKKSCMLSL